LDDQVSHYEVPGAIRVLAVAPDDTLYIGAGCGVVHFQAGRLETLLNVDCNESGRRPSLLPMEIVFEHNDLVWVGGALNIASYDGQSWQEYGLPALRVAVDHDDTIWTVGWDGRNGSDCCITHLTAKGPVSYTWPAGAQVPPEVLNKLFGPQIR
jgi:hypothetical protein